MIMFIFPVSTLDRKATKSEAAGQEGKKAGRESPAKRGRRRSVDYEDYGVKGQTDRQSGAIHDPSNNQQPINYCATAVSFFSKGRARWFIITVNILTNRQSNHHHHHHHHRHYHYHHHHHHPTHSSASQDRYRATRRGSWGNR